MPQASACTDPPLVDVTVLLSCRYPPFYDQDITNTYKKIVNGHFTFPTYFPTAARDLVRKLLQVRHTYVIGMG